MEKRIRRVEDLTRRNVRKIGVLTNVVLAMYLALKHKEKKEAQIPLMMSLVLLNILNLIDVTQWFKYINEDDEEM